MNFLTVWVCQNTSLLSRRRKRVSLSFGTVITIPVNTKEGVIMKIIVLKGSPHPNGTSNTLAKYFIKGATESGHTVEEINVAMKDKIHPCLGCDQCGMNGNCIQHDDGNEILSKILNCDAICFVTPVYYFGMSSQLKMMIDRFYARNGAITSKRLKAVLITTAWNKDTTVMKGIANHFDIIFDYLNFEDRGRLYGKGCGTVYMIPEHYYNEAYNLGKNI